MPYDLQILLRWGPLPETLTTPTKSRAHGFGFTYSIDAVQRQPDKAQDSILRKRPLGSKVIVAHL
jgi:hypothetical protein